MPWRLSSEPLSLSIISHGHVARSYAMTSGPPLLLPGPAWSHTLCSAQAVPFMVSCVFRRLSGAGLGPLPWRPLGCCPVSCQAHIPQEVGRGMGPWTESEMREPLGISAPVAMITGLGGGGAWLRASRARTIIPLPLSGSVAMSGS